MEKSQQSSEPLAQVNKFVDAEKKMIAVSVMLTTKQHEIMRAINNMDFQYMLDMGVLDET